MNIKRFAEIFGVDDTVIKEHPNGLYVRYEDYAQEIAALRNDLTAARLERDQLGTLIADHNIECKMACEARKAEDCEPYTLIGRKCPDCPQDWLIELPSDLHPKTD